MVERDKWPTLTGRCCFFRRRFNVGTSALRSLFKSLERWSASEPTKPVAGRASCNEDVSLSTGGIVEVPVEFIET
jgi:hypothetical protein